MLYRKIRSKIEDFLKNSPNKILLVEGARQIGKTYIIRDIGNKMFPNFIEINMAEDKIKNRDFENIKSVEDFYLKISSFAGEKMKSREDTLIFIDEIQEYPELITLLKFLNDDRKYRFIASGSLLEMALAEITSIPIGTIEIMKMYPLDLEEFMIANGFGDTYINYLKENFKNRKSLDEKEHNKVMDIFKKYLLVGGMPDAVNSFIEKNNIKEVRMIHENIINLYKIDCSKYDKEKKLKIQRLYELIPSNMENKKKRVTLRDIENKKGKTKDDYQDEFEYLINSGIAIGVNAISEPRFPLVQSTMKTLIKLYMNDVGLLTYILYRENIKPILEDIESINLGSVYETFAATELKAHTGSIYYYDNKKNGEVDYLVDDYENLTILPIEIKSGKNYYVHSAISNLMQISNYSIKEGLLFSNNKEVKEKSGILHMPIYYISLIN